MMTSGLAVPPVVVTGKVRERYSTVGFTFSHLVPLLKLLQRLPKFVDGSLNDIRTIK